MKALLAATLLGGAIFVAAVPAQAAGCVSGAVVGGAAGHVAGHHGLLGAAAGCAIGHHEAKKDAARQRQAARPSANMPATTSN